jgi:hypothetical protein
MAAPRAWGGGWGEGEVGVRHREDIGVRVETVADPCTMADVDVYTTVL